MKCPYCRSSNNVYSQLFSKDPVCKKCNRKYKVTVSAPRLIITAFTIYALYFGFRGLTGITYFEDYKFAFIFFVSILLSFKPNPVEDRE